MTLSMEITRVTVAKDVSENKVVAKVMENQSTLVMTLVAKMILGAFSAVNPLISRIASKRMAEVAGVDP